MAEELKIRKRIFLVGAPRSGTTLLQSMLAVHPEVCSFPETHFFSRTLKQKGYKAYIDWYGYKKRKRIKALLRRLNEEKLLKNLPFFTFSNQKWARSLISILDDMAMNKGYSMWLEKTPIHLHRVGLISVIAPDTRFIHIIRNGEDVIASLYEVTNLYPEEWKGAKSIDSCINRWKKDVGIAKEYLGVQNHAHVRYENLVKSPESVLRNLCDRIGFDYTSEMLEYRQAAEGLIFDEEKWKDSNVSQMRISNKFQEIFTKEEQQYIKENVADIDIAVFD